MNNKMTKSNSNRKFTLKDQYLRTIIILSSLYGDNYLPEAHGSQLDSHANMIEFGEPSEMFDAKNIPKGVDLRNKAWGHVILYLYSPYI